MTASPFTIRRMDAPSEADLHSALDVLSRSYADDMALEVMVAGDKAVKSLLFRLSLSRSLHEGQTYLAYSGSELCAVAVWIGPSSDWRFHEDPDFVDHLPDETKDWYNHHFVAKWEDLYLSSGTDSARARKDAWKLQWLGILPQHRGKGVSKMLIETMARKADFDNKKIVAEVSNPDYIQKFRGSGLIYRSVKNFSSGRFAGFPIWFLVREPKHGASAGAASAQAS